MSRSKTFVWVLSGFGCGAVVLTILVVVGFWGVMSARQRAADMTDPERRTELARKMLGVDVLPTGYHAMMAMDIPFIMEIVMLSDLEPDAEGLIADFGRRGFIYVKFTRFGPDKRQLKDYFEGRNPDPEILRSNSIDIDIRDTIGRGAIRREDGGLLYLSQRGSVGTRGYHGEGINAQVLFDCPDDARSHLAIWFGPDPSPGKPVSELDLSGSPADETALGHFMSPFHFCGS